MSDDYRVSRRIDEFQRHGLYGFERQRLEADLPRSSSGAIGKALLRLAQKGRIRRIRNGYYVIVPIEFSSQGLPPYDWYLEDLMQALNQPYYVGLLSAAALHGAGHQQVQQLQLVVPRQERPLKSKGLSIRFFRKQAFAATPIVHLKGHSGHFPVSTPEATAFDLIRHARQLGGLDAVTTVLAELAESMSTAGLGTAAAAETDATQIQRIGWLLDHLGQTALADALHHALSASRPLPRTPLDSTAPRIGRTHANRWRILENVQPQSDL